MAGVEGMSFLGGGLHLAGNKENGSGSFTSHDMDDVGSTDFFEQFVMLDEGDDPLAEATVEDLEGSLRLGYFGVSELSLPPHPPPVSSSIDQSFSHATTPQASIGGNAVTDHVVNPSNVRGIRLQQQQRITSDLPIDQIDFDAELTFTTSTFAEPFNYGGAGGGTVSDSELLKLEGLSMRSSPRVEIPTQPASLPASPSLANGGGGSPRKPGRLEAFCTRFRNKTAQIHGKFRPQQNIKQEPGIQQQQRPSIMSTAQIGPTKSSSRPKPTHLNLSKSHQLPLSPPLTGTNGGPMTTPIHPSFINPSYLDDPFLHDQILRGQFNPLPHTPGIPTTPHQTLDNTWSFPDPSANPNWFDTDIRMNDTPHPSDFSLSFAFHQAAVQAASSFEYPPPPPDPLSALHIPTLPQQSSQSSQSRRPKPRAPSSGARHHHLNLSPRKTRSSHNLMDQSSPTKSQHRRTSSGSTGGIPQNVIRKRQSWSTSNHHHGHGQQQGPTRRASSQSLYKNKRTASCSSLNSATLETRKSTEGFVNYTPRDSNLLMTGVAPSGSSKTKARREKEAQDRQRVIKEQMERVLAKAAAASDSDAAAAADFKRLQELTMGEIST
ncbi:hypothetical protein QBC38DRAFT_547328 [Podospora fimiseda]|uniref:Developmental regulatory protein wetA n=1 Tax=Podospora fimiseda TaxID=252190 RepID=A0AAN7BJT0_9PEZI|nr:hypothetical protein QBC38DRAFT_547328 [Podospora fimiseda]